jgi:IS30 family transposase
MNTWRAGCGGSRTSGSEGGPEKPTHRKMGRALRSDPYHSPWQRGQIENLNRQWRWWFPRGTDLAGIDPAHADHAASIINGQRRRSLDYQSPATIYHALTVQ